MGGVRRVLLFVEMAGAKAGRCQSLRCALNKEMAGSKSISFGIHPSYFISL